MYFLYSVVMAAGMLLLAPYFVFRGLRRGKRVQNLRARLGAVTPEIAGRAASTTGTIWLHAVSVGEVLAARPLVERMRERFPGRLLFVSTTTAAGQQVAREQLGGADGVFHFPLDWSHAVRRTLRAIHPAVVVILETEIWPNFLREARRRAVPVVFVNARVSERSFRGYDRVNRLTGGFVARILQEAEGFLAQSEEDARRLARLGARAERIEVAGNLKYDFELPALGRFGQWLQGQVRDQERWPVAVAGSVVADEEEAVLAGFDLVQRRWRRALLVLAPRKPERFALAAGIAAQRGWKIVRRSRVNLESALDPEADVLLLDSIGELAGLYALADVVFIGGSLVPMGGHNMVEPAAFARVPVFGPSTENFRDIAAQFLSAGAAIRVPSGEALGRAWTRLIQDSAERERMGRAARDLVERNRGASARVLERLAAVLADKRGPA